MINFLVIKDNLLGERKIPSVLNSKEGVVSAYREDRCFVELGTSSRQQTPLLGDADMAGIG